MRVCFMALLAALSISACSAPRNSVSELETPRSNAARAVETPAPDYPYTWRPRQLPKEPACYDAAMCYDEKREVCVLYGGRSWWWDGRNTTWIWDGQKWYCEDVCDYGIAAHSLAMTYDHERQEPVMWGEYLDYPYAYNRSWHPATEGAPPKPLSAMAMASDINRGVVVAFGGIGPDSKTSNVLFEIKGETWQQVAPESGPEPQSRALFVYEPAMKKCLLVDQMYLPEESSASSDQVRIWTWNGRAWEATLTDGPDELISSAQALLYDTDRRCPVAVCYRGFDDIYELWELRGLKWDKRETIGAPKFRRGCSVAYDQKRKSLVMQGGEMHLSDLFARDETWLCGGDGKWRCANSPPTPHPYLQYSCMCYDPSRKATVLLEEDVEWRKGKMESTRLVEWQWDGSRWTQCELPDAMPRCQSKIAVFDAQRGSLLAWFGKELWQCSKGTWSKNAKGGVDFCIEGCVYDDRRAVVVLIHGNRKDDASDGVMDHLTTWDGQQLRTTKVDGASPILWRPCFAFDRNRAVIVAFGGWEVPDGGRVWEFDGRSWTKHYDSPCPWGWTCESFCYLSGVGKCVLFGGGAPMASEPRYVSEHWQWDGQKWEALQFSNAPFARSMALIAEDTDRGCLVLFGGLAYRRQYCDTWEYGPDRP